MHSRHKAWEQLTSQNHQSAQPNINFNDVIIDTPLFVLPSQDINLVSTSLAPWNNVAKINAEWNTPYPDNGFDDLSYIFVWENPNDRAFVVNVESYLMVNGFCDVFAEAGPGQGNYALRLSADGGRHLRTGGYNSGVAGGNYDVVYKTFLVPPHRVAVFEVVLDIFHRTEGGYIDVDFASGNFQIICPAVVIAILN
jgi:hypothetical protein